VTGAALGNGLNEKQVYNANTGYLDNGSVVTATNTARLQESYYYDALGNVTQRSQYWDAGGFSETFDYDELNRLKFSHVTGQRGRLGCKAQLFLDDSSLKDAPNMSFFYKVSNAVCWQGARFKQRSIQTTEMIINFCRVHFCRAGYISRRSHQKI
jgi:YD repeat-containing protein